MRRTEVVYKGKSPTYKLVTFIVAAGLYGFGLFLTSFLPTIPGVTWLRPANILSEIFAVTFGWLGCTAVMVGNSFGDLLGGHFSLVSLWWLLPLEFIATAAVIFWGVTDPSLRTLRGKVEWAIWAVVVQGLLTGFGIAFFLCYVQAGAPISAFGAIGWTITLNEGIPAIVGGFVQYALFPLMVKAGLWWGRDLDKSNVPHAYLEELRR